MQRLLRLIAFACCVVTATAECASSKYNQGTRDWLRCSRSGTTELKSNLHWNLIAISVSQSAIPEIPDGIFVERTRDLENLNFHDCGITRISGEAFRGLSSLKKLSLSYNNITELNSAWFRHLPSLEQLDVSFNKITHYDPTVYSQLTNLQRFDLNDNLLGCIPTQNMQHTKLKSIRIHENPMNYTCRAQLTLWLKDHKISYATNDNSDSAMWFDDVLWECLLKLSMSLPDGSRDDQRMDVCVISRLFNQLTTVLGASSSVEISTRECVPRRESLTQCLRSRNVKDNGDTLTSLLTLAHRASKPAEPARD